MFHYLSPWSSVMIASCTKQLLSNETDVDIGRFCTVNLLWSPSNQTEKNTGRQGRKVIMYI